MAWIKLGTTTLGSAGDSMAITDLTAKKFNQFLWHDLSSGNTSTSIRFNANSNAVYSHRNSGNGGADSTQVSQTIIDEPLDYANDRMNIHYVCSISGEEKLGMMWEVTRGTAGATAAPNRAEMVYKFVPSPDADITQISYTNDQSGDYDTSSNLSALGTD